MSWVSYSKLESLCNSLRNKFISNEIVVANSDKSKGTHLNVGGQDGLLTLSPIKEDGITPAALWVTDSSATNATELTGGTLSYVTNVGSSKEDYTSLSLVGNVVNVSGKSGVSRRITNVANAEKKLDAVNLQRLNKATIYTMYTPENITYDVSYQGEFGTANAPFGYGIYSNLFDINFNTTFTANTPFELKIDIRTTYDLDNMLIGFVTSNAACEDFSYCYPDPTGSSLRTHTAYMSGYFDNADISTFQMRIYIMTGSGTKPSASLLDASHFTISEITLYALG